MKKILITGLIMSLQGCSTISIINDKTEVRTEPSWWTPGVTIVEDIRTGITHNYAGPSIIGQLSGYAVAAGMTTFGAVSTIGKTSNSTNVNGGGSSVTGTVAPQIQNTSSSGANSSSLSNSTSVINP